VLEYDSDTEILKSDMSTQAPHIAFDPSKIKLVDPKSLTLDPNNRNKHSQEQIDRFVKLIQKYGMRWPVLVSEQTGLVKAGEGRILAAIQAGMSLIPVSYQDFESSEIEYGFGISDNAIAAWAELDLGSINTDLGELGPDFDIDLLGMEHFKVDVADHNVEPNEKELDENIQTDHECPSCGYVW
jgi:hypothetical protein